jgi:hypothetical protein
MVNINNNKLLAECTALLAKLTNFSQRNVTNNGGAGCSLPVP